MPASQPFEKSVVKLACGPVMKPAFFEPFCFINMPAATPDTHDDWLSMSLVCTKYGVWFTPWPPATYQTVFLHTGSDATGMASFNSDAAIATMSGCCWQRLRAACAACESGTLLTGITCQPLSLAKLFASTMKLS